MRKVLLGAIAAMFVFAIMATGSAYAGGKCDILGKIKSVDTAKSEFVIVPSGTKDEVTVKVDEEYMAKKGGSTIKEGNVVEVFMNDDKTMATKIKRSINIPVGC